MTVFRILELLTQILKLLQSLPPFFSLFTALPSLPDFPDFPELPELPELATPLKESPALSHHPHPWQPLFSANYPQPLPNPAPADLFPVTLPILSPRAEVGGFPLSRNFPQPPISPLNNAHSGTARTPNSPPQQETCRAAMSLLRGFSLQGLSFRGPPLYRLSHGIPQPLGGAADKGAGAKAGAYALPPLSGTPAPLGWDFNRFGDIQNAENMGIAGVMGIMGNLKLWGNLDIIESLDRLDNPNPADIANIPNIPNTPDQGGDTTAPLQSSERKPRHYGDNPDNPENNDMPDARLSRLPDREIDGIIERLCGAIGEAAFSMAEGVHL